MSDHHDDRAQGNGDLDDFFAAARTTPPPLSNDLLAAIMADARTARDGALAPRARAGAWRGLREALGGWPGLAGLGSALATGLVLGLVSPAPLTFMQGMLVGEFDAAGIETAALEGYMLEDMMPGYEALGTEAWP